MGAAKKRGTREQRVQAGIQKNRQEVVAVQEQAIKKESEMTKEERVARAQAQYKLAIMMGVVTMPSR